MQKYLKIPKILCCTVLLSCVLNMVSFAKTPQNIIYDFTHSSNNITIYKLDGDLEKKDLYFKQSLFHYAPEAFLTGIWVHAFTYYKADEEQIVMVSQRLKDFLEDPYGYERYWRFIDNFFEDAGTEEADTNTFKLRRVANYLSYLYQADDDFCYDYLEDGNYYQLMEIGKSCSFIDAVTFMGCCMRLGFPCKYIEGTVSGQPHIWNAVRIDDKWIYVDIPMERAAEKKGAYLFFEDISNRTIEHEYTFSYATAGNLWDRVYRKEMS